MASLDIDRKEKKLVESYKVIADNVPATVNIWDVKEENIPIYDIILPKLGVATEAMLNAMIGELAKEVPVDTENITDSEQAGKVKDFFYTKTRAKVKELLKNISEQQADLFAGILLHKMYGLGEMEIILADNALEEVVINGVKQPISIYHKKHGWCKTGKFLDSEEEIYNFSAQIGRKIGREITSLNPIMDAYLLTGDRVASTLFPISTAGNTITIRRFARSPWTVAQFVNPQYNTMSKEIAAFIWLAMQYELNIIVAGGTASGKTSVLNTLCSFIPPKQRIISIEDTREINLPKALHWNWVPLTSRNQNPEGQGEVTMLNLIVASLRMRPDRIVVGEIRKREQAEALFEAMHTGHSVYATMHADTAEQVKRRLIEPPISVPKSEVESLQLVLVQYRDRRRGIRRTLEVAEILSEASEKADLELNYLWRWHPRDDVFEKVNDSIRVVEDLNLHTGMTPQEINTDLKDKQKILQWMVDSKLTDIDKIGHVMHLYYKNPEILENAIKKKINADRLLSL
ncbi:type II/IV secretion system ATPase subunit [Candidatus Woesearchaeota archaeon]|nr:type II/IV secretion system ATPase subunit [Candidatus Woesearchaeota archaeon]